MDYTHRFLERYLKTEEEKLNLHASYILRVYTDEETILEYLREKKLESMIAYYEKKEEYVMCHLLQEKLKLWKWRFSFLDEFYE